jgi:hypothetical protein
MGWNNTIARVVQRAIAGTLLALVVAVSTTGCLKATNDRPQRGGGSETPSLARTESPRGAQKSTSATSTEASAEDQTVTAVSEAIRKHHLVNSADQCLAYQFDAQASADDFVVEVRENHRHSECGGDPQTSPRLFTVRVSKTTGDILTDANSAPGEFHALSK